MLPCPGSLGRQLTGKALNVQPWRMATEADPVACDCRTLMKNFSGLLCHSCAAGFLSAGRWSVVYIREISSKANFRNVETCGGPALLLQHPNAPLFSVFCIFPFCSQATLARATSLSFLSLTLAVSLTWFASSPEHLIAPYIIQLILQ